MMLSVNYLQEESQALHSLAMLRAEMTFGRRLRLAREKRGLSQTAVGAFFEPKVTRNAISLWESDKNQPELSRLPILARRLRVRTDYLLELTEDSAEPPTHLKKEALELAQQWQDLPAFLAHSIRERLRETLEYAGTLSPLVREKVFGRVPEGDDYRALESEFINGIVALRKMRGDQPREAPDQLASTPRRRKR